MANTNQLPLDVLEVVAQQIGARLGNFSHNETLFPTDALSEEQPAVDLGETFEVWSLPPDALEEIAKGVDLSAVARQTGIWHHQIRTNNVAQSFARSKPLGATADSWSLRELFVSPLAEHMGKAIDWVEANVPANTEVRYLNLPQHQVDAFWLLAQSDGPDFKEWNNKIVIIRAGVSSALNPLDVLSSPDFFGVLEKEDRGGGLRHSKGAIEMATKKAAKKGSKKSAGKKGFGGSKTGGGAFGGSKRGASGAKKAAKKR